jgi:hypothetical protein
MKTPKDGEHKQLQRKYCGLMAGYKRFLDAEDTVFASPRADDLTNLNHRKEKTVAIDILLLRPDN